MKVTLACLALLVAIYMDSFTNGIPLSIDEDGLIRFGEPAHLNQRLIKRSTSSERKKKPEGGVNMDRGLGKNKNKDKPAPKKATFPWDSTKAQEKIRMEPSERLKSFAVDGEEPFPEVLYDDYDFEFPKGMQLNDNFEGKVRRVMEMRLNGNMTEIGEI